MYVYIIQRVSSLRGKLCSISSVYITSEESAFKIEMISLCKTDNQPPRHVNFMSTPRLHLYEPEKTTDKFPLSSNGSGFDQSFSCL